MQFALGLFVSFELLRFCMHFKCTVQRTHIWERDDLSALHCTVYISMRFLATVLIWCAES